MSTDVAESSAKPAVSKGDLKQLIAEAASGDTAKIERLIAPFLTPGERLMWCGVSAKMGLLTTYDFAFLTDRRVGDLEVTPYTGALNLEICYLQHIDAYVIVQPSITFKLITTVAMGYPVVLALAWGIGFAFGATLAMMDFREIAFALFILFGIVMSVLGIVVWTLFGMRGAKRWLLHFNKSGIYFKLRASEIGSFVFADRDKLAMVTSLARMVTEQKRVLDRETN